MARSLLCSQTTNQMLPVSIMPTPTNTLRRHFNGVNIRGVSVKLKDKNNLFQWRVEVPGPPATPYQGMVLYLMLSFPENYPKNPPVVKFITKIKHPNVHPDDGRVSIPILRPPLPDAPHKKSNDRWSPSTHTAAEVIRSIIKMLSCPVNKSSPKIKVSASRTVPQVAHNVSVPRKAIGFCGRDKHVMVKHRELKTLFDCDGCKQKGSGRRYICEKCPYELHQECEHAKPETCFDYFKEVMFRFFDEPQKSCPGADRYCDVCTIKILGFNYQSVDRKYDLHPCCGKLGKKIQTHGTVFDLRGKKKSKCIWCKEKKVSWTSPVKGLEYASSCGKFVFHVHCMMDLLHANASVGDGNHPLELEKIDLKHLAKYKEKQSKTWGQFAKVVDLALQLLSVLLGIPLPLITVGKLSLKALKAVA